jgi:hypothetical protein
MSRERASHEPHADDCYFLSHVPSIAIALIMREIITLRERKALVQAD